MMTDRRLPKVVDMEHIADYCGVQRITAKMWRQRGRLPKEAGTVSGKPYWWRSTIEKWAQEYGYPRVEKGITLKVNLGQPR